MIYIGLTSKSLSKRFKRHIYNAKNRGDTHLYRAMRLHGTKNFVIELVEDNITTFENALKREKHHIDLIDQDKRYNETMGGEGCNLTWSNKIKLSKLLKSMSVDDVQMLHSVACEAYNRGDSYKRIESKIVPIKDVKTLIKKHRKKTCVFCFAEDGAALTNAQEITRKSASKCSTFSETMSVKKKNRPQSLKQRRSMIVNKRKTSINHVREQCQTIVQMRKDGALLREIMHETNLGYTIVQKTLKNHENNNCAACS